MNVSDYMLSMEDKGTIYVVKNVPDLLRQLSSMANNLNQLTHLCHMGKIKDPEILFHIQKMMQQVEELILLLSSILQQCKNSKFKNRVKLPKG